MTRITLGTRGSALALAQADAVRTALNVLDESISVEIVVIKTSGDRLLDSPLSVIGGKGLFVREIETALERGEIDIAVHSLKDLPTELPAALELAGMLPRQDVRDALISRDGKKLSELGPGAIVATSSLRRKAELVSFNRVLRVVDIRGNVETRIRKMEEGACDALVLAAAGLARLGAETRITERLDPSVFMPSAGQGIIGLEARRGDNLVTQVIQRLTDTETFLCGSAERALLEGIGGGCQIPLGCLSRMEEGHFSITGCLIAVDGGRRVQWQVSGLRERAIELGAELAAELLRRGGAEILAECEGGSSYD